MQRTNTQTSEDENNSKSLSDAKSELENRLEELDRWQDERKKALEERKTTQLRMLNMEQQNVYGMLRLLTQTKSKATQQIASPISMENDTTNETEPDEQDDTDVTLDMEHTQGTTTGYCSEVPQIHVEQQPAGKIAKMPFLKRGEGLKQRFKVDPQHFRLHNLPRYKYAKAHAKLYPMPRKQSSKVSNSNTKQTAQKLKSTTELPIKVKPILLDVQEERFQHMLLAGMGTCSSTPDLKVCSGKSVNVRPLPATATNTEKPPSWAQVLNPKQIKPVSVTKLREVYDEFDIGDNLSMFELLERKASEGEIDLHSTTIQKLIVHRQQQKKQEKNALESALLPADDIPVDNKLVEAVLQPAVKNLNIAESVTSEADDEDEDDDEQTESQTIVDNEETKHFEKVETEKTLLAEQIATAPRVHFADDSDICQYQDEEPSEESVPDTASSSEAGQEEQDEVDGDDDEQRDQIVGEEQSHGQEECDNAEDTATTANDKSLFEHFKQALFAALQANVSSQLMGQNERTTTSPPSRPGTPSKVHNEQDDKTINNELQEKTQLVRERLIELEREIATFKKNNQQLFKAQQQLELQRSHFERECNETVEKLKDERIQFEIYMHDERMKVEQEKHKAEQQIRAQKTQGKSKERQELTALKQKVEELQLQLKNKEQTHIAAQARLRTQIRHLEKEQRVLQDEIDQLNKDQKKLQAENLRISREQNNKMLHEINRNIARLAPKLLQSETAEKPAAPTTAAAARKNAKQTASVLPKKNAAACGKKPTRLSLNKGKTTTNTVTDFEMVPESDDDDEIANDTASESENAQEKQSVQIKSTTAVEENPKADSNNFKREILNEDGSKDIWYPNGNLKKISADGMQVRMLYFNKDIKETNINEGTVKYYYAATNVWHTTYLDGLEILEFPNGQTEHRHKNGLVEVHFPNNSIKIIDPADEDKLEEWRFADGTHLVQKHNGEKILTLPNGQKEVHTKLCKRREYPDGTVKLVYPDGSQETRYSNGRIRLKDKEGNLIMDTAA